ncbi:hypothetical protein ACH4PU_32825 [Streptomyces sp. NPDC021100]|uniref:hypothetical protein n=1 Tax=Streptomyces sp. NPDC021100 TaxID=3365114 RepID=UPI0037B3350B
MLSLPIKPRPECADRSLGEAVERALYAARQYRKAGAEAHLRPGPNNWPQYLQRALVELMTGTDRPEVYHAMVTATEMVAELIEEAGGTWAHRTTVLDHIAMDLHAAGRHHPLPPTENGA